MSWKVLCHLAGRCMRTCRRKSSQRIHLSSVNLLARPLTYASCHLITPVTFSQEHHHHHSTKHQHMFLCLLIINLSYILSCCKCLCCPVRFLAWCLWVLMSWLHQWWDFEDWNNHELGVWCRQRDLCGLIMEVSLHGIRRVTWCGWKEKNNWPCVSKWP